MARKIKVREEPVMGGANRRRDASSSASQQRHDAETDE